MNYVITGSLGNISKPIVQKLKANGHSVTVITSNSGKSKDIETLRAIPAVGSVEDAGFLSKVFSGVDAVYLMIPPNPSVKGSFLEYQKRVATNYAKAVGDNKIKHAVLLSSVGAHLGKGTGPIDGVSIAEWHLSQLKDLNLKILRPSYFYYNLFGQIPMVKNANIFGANYGSTQEKLVLVHPDDIAEVAAAELLSLKFKGKTIKYIASDERHPKEIAEVLGNGVGKPGIPWVEFKNDDALNGMLQAGLNKEIASGYIAMGEGLKSGKIQADYWKNRPKLGKVKLEDFLKQFAAAYNS